ncbi:MAG: DUF418 domain-containing transporter [Spirochaetes bacterium]|nr:DUF418 domain-containing transporter [Spirochaetota bacterium]
MAGERTNQSAAEQPHRILPLDLLRGIAVILMIQQHLGAWFWNVNRERLDDNYLNLPLLFLNMLGGLSAPLFVTLAGCGTVLLARRYARPGKRLVFRGLCIMAFGYILNLLSPHWFSLCSWYVLQLIGFAYILSPLLLRIPGRWLHLLPPLILIGTIVIQNCLGTPLSLDNRAMSDTGLPGGALRLALAEGHFPLFPWLAFFVCGMGAGRLMASGRGNRITLLASVYYLTGVILSALYLLDADVTRLPSLVRFFRLSVSFYPAQMPLALLLIAAVLFAVEFSVSHKRINPSAGNPVVCLGRLPLTLLLFHAVVFRELGIRLGFHRIFSEPATLMLIAVIIAAAAVVAHRWQRAGYKYSLEWVMRRIAG